MWDVRRLAEIAYSLQACRSSLAKPDAHAALRTERNAGERFNGLSRDQADLKALGDGCQQNRRLQHGKAVSDAHARAAAEGKIRKLGQRLLSIARPPFRSKGLQIGRASC